MAEARLLDLSTRIEAAGDDGLLPGDSVQLVLRTVVGEGDTPRFPDAETLEKALQGSGLVLDGPQVSAPTPAANGAQAVEASWTVQLLLPPGDHELGPVPVAVTNAAGEVGESLDAPGAPITVGTALSEELVARLEEAAGQGAMPQLVAEELAPVRGPWSLKGRLPWELGVTVGVVGLLLAVAIGWFLARWFRNRVVPAAPSQPLPPPEVEARARLAELPALLDQGEHLAFHVELATTLKRYLGRRYQRDLLELTTDEVRRLLAGPLREAPNLPRSREGVLRVLGACDLVKFARQVPRREESMTWFDEVEDVVERTTPVPVAEPESSEEEAA
jgi:hypothetical protein